MSKRSRADLAVLERMALLRAERLGASRREEQALEDHLAQTLTLGALRGDRIDAPQAGPGERRKPYRRLDGVDWLAKKGRLTPNQCAAAERYGSDWRRAHYEVLPSASAFNVGGGGDKEGPQEARRRAAERLAKTRTRALSGHAGMIALCDQVCGQGLQVSELAGSAPREADRLEGRLTTALDLLAAFYSR